MPYTPLVNQTGSLTKDHSSPGSWNTMMQWLWMLKRNILLPTIQYPAKLLSSISAKYIFESVSVKYNIFRHIGSQKSCLLPTHLQQNLPENALYLHAAQARKKGGHPHPEDGTQDEAKGTSRWWENKKTWDHSKSQFKHSHSKGISSREIKIHGLLKCLSYHHHLLHIKNRAIPDRRLYKKKDVIMAHYMTQLWTILDCRALWTLDTDLTKNW